MSVVPARMAVYVYIKLGEIEDWGPHRIKAFLGTGEHRKPIGVFNTRQEAREAVEREAPDGAPRR